MGKTALMLNLILNANVSTGFFSSEMAAMQGAMRMISTVGSVNASKLRNADMGEDEWSGYNAGMSLLHDRPVYIDDQSKPTIDELQRQARIWKQEHDIKCLHVDYIQRIDAMEKRAPKHLQVEEVAQGLKSLAKELRIPIIALAQVNRNVESRSNRRPNMGDLKDSGAIEQEADQIMILYRDEVYDKETNDKGIAELSIEKNRHGQTGGIRLSWEAQYMRFRNLSTGYEGYQ
jgi:replicative DNA helicase